MNMSENSNGESKSQVDKKRKLKDRHNATICAEVRQLEDGSLIHFGQTREGKEYAMLRLCSEDYGYIKAFFKRELIKGDWATEMQRLNRLGVRFEAEFSLSYQFPHDDGQQGCWIGIFVRFVNEQNQTQNKKGLTMKITKKLLSEIFEWYIADLHEARICAKYAEDYFSAFQAGTLDIEGYERVERRKEENDN